MVAVPILTDQPGRLLAQARDFIRVDDRQMARQTLGSALSFLCDYIPAVSPRIEHCLETITVASRIYAESAQFGELTKDRERLAAVCSNLGTNFSNAFLIGSETMRQSVCRSKPHSLQLLITTDCNLSCIMCGRVRIGHKTLRLEAFEKVWAFLPSVSILSWQGGEVFIVEYFKELLRKIIAEFPHITHQITTNGLLIDQEMAEILAEGNVSLIFSIDSVVKKTYEGIRRGGNFDTLLRNLEMVGSAYAKRNCSNRFKLNVVVMQQNMGELHLFPAFCRKYGFGGFTYGYLRPLDPHDDLLLEQNPGLVKELSAIIGENERQFNAMGVGTSGDLKVVLKNEMLKHAGVPSDEEKTQCGGDGSCSLKKAPRCVRPWTNIAVFYDGTIKPSCECGLSLGNIYNDSLENVWNGNGMLRYREGMMNGKLNGMCVAACIDGVIQKEYEYLP